MFSDIFPLSSFIVNTVYLRKYMSYHEQNDFFARAYRTGTDAWTSIPFTRRAHELAMYLPKGAMILDLGAGRGRTMYGLADLGYRVIGIENNTELVNAGNEEVKAKGLGKEIRFMEGDALDIPFHDGSFDAVVDVGLLHHLKNEDFAPYVKELARVLKQGGHAFVVALSKKTTQYLAWRPNTSDTSDFTHEGVRYHFFEEGELSALFESLFVISYINYDSPHGPDGPIFAVMLLKKK